MDLDRSKYFREFVKFEVSDTKGKKMKTRITIRMTDKLMALLDKECHQSKRTKADVIRMILESALIK